MVKPENEFNHNPPTLRSIIFERDDWSCQMCARTKDEVQLTVHHKKPLSTHPELRRVLKNLITVCVDCHTQHHRVVHNTNKKNKVPLPQSVPVHTDLPYVFRRDL